MQYAQSYLLQHRGDAGYCPDGYGSQGGGPTIIKRDGDGDRKVIEKRERTDVLPVPHTEEKTIIKKERD
jgi:hypothetical protein